ncbi:MAG: hypothetical protein AAB731_01015 [Patescibacteria group bacterium]
MWPFRKKKTVKSAPERPKHKWEDKKYEFSDYERQILLKLREMPSPCGFTWCGDVPANGSVKCPYCTGPIGELHHSGEVEFGLCQRISDGIFCLRCGGELVCAMRGCRYKVGDALVGGLAHWGFAPGHYTFKLKKHGRNLRDIIIAKLAEIEGAKKTENGEKQLPPPEPEDEYKKLESRLDEIAEKERALEAEKDEIKRRMWEIDYVIAEGLLGEMEQPAGLLQAAGGDVNIIRESEAEADELAPAAEEP